MVTYCTVTKLFIGNVCWFNFTICPKYFKAIEKQVKFHHLSHVMKLWLLFFLRNFILQIRMRSHPAGLDI